MRVGSRLFPMRALQQRGSSTRPRLQQLKILLERHPHLVVDYIDRTFMFRQVARTCSRAAIHCFLSTVLVKALSFPHDVTGRTMCVILTVANAGAFCSHWKLEAIFHEMRSAEKEAHMRLSARPATAERPPPDHSAGDHSCDVSSTCEA